MDTRVMGRTGMRASVLGFGGAEIGLEGATPDTAASVLNEALDLGVNVIDTAECYGNSEELIGAAVAHRRADFLLFTKVGHEDGLSAQENWSVDSILRTIDRSLDRLRTDFVDLVQLHSCDESVLRRGEAVAALQNAKTAGKTRFIGYSGDSHAARFAVECGLFDTLQTSVNIADQEALSLTLPLANDRGMGVIAKRPLANAAWRYTTTPKNEYHVEYWTRLRALKYDFLTRPDAAAVALRFTLSAPGVHTAIVGTTRPGRLAENAAIAAQGPLPTPDFEAIRQRWKHEAKPAWVGQI